jgi:hypothetical protein
VVVVVIAGEVVVLSEAERQALRGIEERITAEDPGLAAALGGCWRRFDPSRWSRLGHDAVAVVAVLGALLCGALAGAGAAPAGIVSAGFAVLTVAVRLRRFPRRGPTR